MRRCTACSEFNPGRPAFCGNCGRSFDARLCPRGHRNHRAAQFCGECGSADLSTPAPPASLLARASSIALAAVCLVAVASVALAAWAGVMAAALSDRQLSALLIVLVGNAAFACWTWNQLPGPVRRIAKAVGRRVMRSDSGRRRR
jgi:hypothetical protein